MYLANRISDTLPAVSDNLAGNMSETTASDIASERAISMGANEL
jgi:hypothetical protein